MEDSSLCYECRDSPLHGKGMFATKDIPAGKLILIEDALWTIPSDTLIRCYPFRAQTGGTHKLLDFFYNGEHGEHEILRKLRRHAIQFLPGGWDPELAPTESLDEAFEIHETNLMKGRINNCASDESLILASKLHEIILKNGKTDDLSPGESRWAAVFEQPSMINHSCMLSAEQVVVRPGDEGPAMFSLVAARDIRRGEEITIQYTRSFATTTERAEYLQEMHGFVCTCELCSQSKKRKAATDERRSKAGHALLQMRHCWGVLQDSIVELAERPGSERRVALLRHTINLCCEKLLEFFPPIMKLKASDEVSDYAALKGLCIACEAVKKLGRTELQKNFLKHAIEVLRKYGLQDTIQARDLVSDSVELCKKELAAKAAKN